MPLTPLLLQIQTGKHRGRRVRLSKAEILIGRSEEATIRIASVEVSREHCRLIPMGDHIRVIDLRSRNGTFVDGRPVNGERLLSPGGTLTVGPLTFLLVGKEETARDQSVTVAIKGKTGTTEELSEEKIVNWLSDYEIPITAANASRETSIIKGAAPAGNPDSAVDIASLLFPPSGKPVAAPGQSRSVREEAREIIQRHYDSLNPG